MIPLNDYNYTFLKSYRNVKHTIVKHFLRRFSWWHPCFNWKEIENAQEEKRSKKNCIHIDHPYRSSIMQIIHQYGSSIMYINHQYRSSIMHISHPYRLSIMYINHQYGSSIMHIHDPYISCIARSQTTNHPQSRKMKTNEILPTFSQLFFEKLRS